MIVCECLNTYEYCCVFVRSCNSAVIAPQLTFVQRFPMLRSLIQLLIADRSHSVRARTRFACHPTSSMQRSIQTEHFWNKFKERERERERKNKTLFLECCFQWNIDELWKCYDFWAKRKEGKKRERRRKSESELGEEEKKKNNV